MPDETTNPPSSASEEAVTEPVASDSQPAGEQAADKPAAQQQEEASTAVAVEEAPAAEPPPAPEPQPSSAKTARVSPRPLELPDFGAAEAPRLDAKRISMLSDVNLRVKIELGRTQMLVEDVLKLDVGSVVELDRLAGDPVDLYVNDRLLARGEVLVLNDNFCVRVSEVISDDPHRVIQ